MSTPVEGERLDAIWPPAADTEPDLLDLWARHDHDAPMSGNEKRRFNADLPIEVFQMLDELASLHKLNRTAWITMTIAEKHREAFGSQAPSTLESPGAVASSPDGGQQHTID